MNFVSVLGYKVFSDNLSAVSLNDEKSIVVNTISPNSYGIAKKDNGFKAALQNADILVLDGVYFALASVLLHGKNIQRNQGPDVFYHFMNRLNTMNGKVFFMGSSNNTLSKIVERAKVEYPSIGIATYSPPFKDEFSENENHEIINAINYFAPDVVFVGMTCPKQEKWSIKNKHLINAKLIISIGNVFDWYAGTQKAIHPFWFKIRLGWLVRIFLRPEIFKRNIGNQMNFFKDVLLIFFKIKREPS